jgi:transcriptional regulator with XRE-family HTH domain
MRLRKLLDAELSRRRERNRRYSLRAFARDLSVHHATLSRVLRGRQRMTGLNVEVLAARLRIDRSVVLAGALADADAAVLAAVARARFRPDSRWLATQTGMPLDEVNAALLRLLRQRMLRMDSPREWVVTVPETDQG